MRSVLLAGVLLGSGGPALAQAEAGSSQDGLIEAGVAAYREGDVSRALDLFLQSQAAGVSSDTLTFNLGLVYYRLGEYLRARQSFESLLASADFSVAAEYHLGLIAARRGNVESAIAHLHAVAREDNPPEMRSLAHMALQRITATAQAPRATGRLTIGAGYDSNPSQQPETEALPSGQREDSLAQMIGSLSYPLGTLVNPVAELHGNAYLRDYFVDNFFDQYGADVGLRRAWQWGAWDGTYGLAGTSSFLDGDFFQSSASLGAEGSYRSGDSTLTLRLRSENLRSTDEYDYLDGWRHRFELTQSVPVGRFLLGATFESELNNRRDLYVGDQFFSQSPMRNTVTARLSHGLGARLSLDWHGRYRRSSYRTPHRLVLNEVVSEQLRADDFMQWGVAARFRGSRNLGYLVDYKYNRNLSSLERYEYARHSLLLAVDWRY